MEINYVHQILKLFEGNELTNSQGHVKSWSSISTQNHDNSFIYPEICGYYLSFASYAYQIGQIRKESEIFKKARLTRDWLLEKCLTDKNLFCVRTSKDYFNTSYFFDSSIILCGLLNFESIEPTNKINQINEILNHQFTLFFKNNEIIPIIGNRPVLDTWSTLPGPHHFKNIICLIKADLNSSNRDRLDIFFNLLCKKFIKQNNEIVISDSNIHIHQLLYAIEGLSYYYHFHKKESVILDIIDINMRKINSLIKDGYLPRYITSQEINYSPRVDIYFQYLRMLKISNNLGVLKSHIESCVNIEQFQSPKGFLFGANSKGEKLDHINSWGNMMAYQYLSLDNNEHTALEYLI